jgi:hypothetical protein
VAFFSTAVSKVTLEKSKGCLHPDHGRDAADQRVIRGIHTPLVLVEQPQLPILL